MTLTGRISFTGFSTAIRITCHLKVSAHGGSRRVHKTIILPGKANGARHILIFTGNRGTGRTRTTKTSCMNSTSVIRGVRNK